MILDRERGRAIALAYESLRRYNPAARASWDAMARDEAAQYGRLVKSVFCEPWRGEGQPYKGSGRMRSDVLLNRHLWVFPGGSVHPCRTPDQVFRGRAVHDVYGHALPGNAFSPDGELAAFRAHAPMYSWEALPALACDNLGQTCYFYFHPVNCGRVIGAREWPEQKVDFLPAELWRDLL